MTMNRQDNDTIRIIVCRSKERAEVIEIRNELKSMQEIVGGPIEEYMPFDDPQLEEIALVCNEEARMEKLPKNRAICSENGEILDIIQGDFFLCYAPIAGEKYESMPPDLERKLLEKFEEPEGFET